MEAETPRTAWTHPLHDRPAGAGFWLQDPLSLGALYKPLPDGAIKSDMPVYIRDLEIEIPSGHLVTGHIIATDPRGQSLLPKSVSAKGEMSALAKSEVVTYRVIRGAAEFKDNAGATHELVAGDVITAGKGAIELVAVGENTQVLRLGLMNSMESLRRWTPAQRDEVDGPGRPDHHAKGIAPAADGNKSRLGISTASLALPRPRETGMPLSCCCWSFCSSRLCGPGCRMPWRAAVPSSPCRS